MSEDTISRKAAIDAMEDVDWYHINSNGQLVHGANSKEDEPLYKAEDVYKVLEQLPPAQPEPCEDTISRQAVLDALQKHFNPTGAELSPDLASVLTGVGVVINTMPSSPSRPSWIPCSERLPEENGQYLITVKYVHVDGYDDIYAEHGEWTDGKWDMFCFGHCGKVENIIAWMPLPEPYREE